MYKCALSFFLRTKHQLLKVVCKCALFLFAQNISFEKMREEYEIQKKQQMNNDVMALLKGDFDLSSMDKTLSDLANISEKLGWIMI